MAHTAFAISEEDIEHVLNKFVFRVANSEGLSFAEMADSLWSQIDHGAIERAALHGMEMDAQTSYAHSEIAAQLVRMGVLEEARENSPRTVAFKVMGNDEGFGPSWVQFEINDQYLARLDEVANVLRRVGDTKAVAGLDMLEIGVNFYADWRGRQGGFFDEEEQTNVGSAVLNVAAVPSGTGTPLIMISARAALRHTDARVETAPIELAELMEKHELRPAGEILAFENRCFVNDTPEGMDFLREIREADEVDRSYDAPRPSHLEGGAEAVAMAREDGFLSEEDELEFSQSAERGQSMAG